MSGHTDAIHRTTQARWCSSELRSGVGVASPGSAPGFISLSAAWPLHSYLELGALSGAVPCARLRTQALLREWGLRELTDVTELLVAEIITNAVVTTTKHQLDTPVRWRLSSNHAQVLIEVWDGDVTPPPAPSPNAPPPTVESGRGLLIVDTLSARWSWYSLRSMPGKVVWA